MIPLQLTLKNFLSYREATLDFRGLHVACICGANGAGKSSLLEAIAWAVWGQSRAMTEEDVIHLGAMEVLVDFTFQSHQQIYRVLRSRQRGQASTLEFQVQTPKGFRSLTEKGVRATQQVILQHLKLDYETFINSAYLRQGRADEFMLKRPSDRKQILADLLKLDQYDQLGERAREQAREYKAEQTALEKNLAQINQRLSQTEELATAIATLTDELQQLQQQQDQDAQQMRSLQTLQQQRQATLHQLTLQQQQQDHLQQDCQHLEAEQRATHQQLQQLQAILRDQEAIATQYTRWQQLQAEEENLTARFQAHQTAQTHRQQLQQQQAEQIAALKDQLRQAETQRQALWQQQQEIQTILSKASDIETALSHLQQARAKLTHLDQLQMQAVPLGQRQQQVQSQLDRLQARLMARFQELQSLQQQLIAQQQHSPQLEQTAREITEQIAYLEKRRAYQQLIREKGVERRNFLERLQERQREFERDLAELDQKIALLSREEAVVARSPATLIAAGDRAAAQSDAEPTQLSLYYVSSPPQTAAVYPPCPLCDRPLDEHHWHHVLEHHQTEREEVCHQLWVIREQLTTSDREIRVLRQEYREVEKEIEQYGAVLERRGQLQQQLQNMLEGQRRLQQIEAELVEIEKALQTVSYAPELQQELQLLNQTLVQLQYDEKNHALARGEVDRWRWAEIKQAEIKQAQRKQAQIEQSYPQLDATIAQLEAQLSAIAQSPLQQQIDQLDRHLAAIGYHLEHHKAVREALRQAQAGQTRYQELLQAQRHYPQIQQRLEMLNQRWQARNAALEAVRTQAQSLQNQLEQMPDPSPQLQTLEQQMQQRRSQLDDCLSQLGRLQQQQQHLEMLSVQSSEVKAQLQTVQRQSLVYQELAQAFSKNGIQALMIENVLPQLEAETNQLLGRLSANQLHVQFVTQRAKRSGMVNRTVKFIDTLDILISDVQGTRPYETYSGGEAFRVNFAIRLALARLLAQRSGTPLQLLIVDEGFGTQDEVGCDRLIGAINAIASDFACVLMITHVPHLKESFQTRIEVYKTDQGSQLRLLS